MQNGLKTNRKIAIEMQKSFEFKSVDNAAQSECFKPQIQLTVVERINKVSSGGRVSIGFYGFLRSLAGRPLGCRYAPNVSSPDQIGGAVYDCRSICFSSWNDLLTEIIAEKKLTPQNAVVAT